MILWTIYRIVDYHVWQLAILKIFYIILVMTLIIRIGLNETCIGSISGHHHDNS
jgi:hypothetical protein